MDYLNQWSPVITILLAVIPAVVVMVLIRLTAGGTDHCFHLTLIDQIRANRHRFVRSHDFHLIKPETIYPQLMHWCLSFFGRERAEFIGTYLSVVFMLLSAGTLVGFSYLIYPHVAIYTSLPSNVFVAGVLAIYVLTPNAYSASNAKNKGMSGRSIGLFFSELYLYLMVLYILGEGTWLLVPAVCVVIIILMINIFAMQFIYFASPLLSLFFWDGMFLLVPAVGTLAFMALMPRYSVCYFRSQWEHKYNYSKYLADLFILKSRFSIWRDFVWEFWRICASGFSRKINGIGGLQYIYYNAVVIVLLCMPAVTVTLVAMIILTFDEPVSSVPSFQSLKYLFIPICVALLIFWLTSFRKTRFLGEPERYVEIICGLVSIVSVLILFAHPVWYFLLLGLSLALVTVHLFLYIRILRNRRNSSTGEVFSRIHASLSREQKSLNRPVKILSNSFDISRTLLDLRFQCFTGIALPGAMAGIPLSEVIDRYPILFPSVVPAMVKAYYADYVVIDTKEMPDPDQVMATEGIRLFSMLEEGHIHLYRVDQVDTT